MAFIVLDQSRTPKGKVLYLQFGDECATIEEARKRARFPNLRNPIIVDLEKVERVPERLVLAADPRPASRPGRKR